MTQQTQRLGNSASLAEGVWPWVSAMDRIAFSLLLASVVWAPWPLGSNRPWALAILGGLLGCAFALACVAKIGLRTAPAADIMKPAVFAPLGALSGFALLVAAQLLPGWAADGGTVSIDAHYTRRYLFTTLVYAAAWGTVLLTVGNTRKRSVLLLGMIVAAGVAQAAVAVLLASTHWRYELWFAEFEQGGRANGTFVNPDHLAGYMELTLSAGLGLLLAQFESREQKKTKSWQATAAVVLAFFLSIKMLLRLVLVVMVIALVMTHSRMGNGAFFLALLLVGAAVAVRSQRLRRPALWLVVSMALVDVFVIGQWVGLDRVLQRIQDTAQSSLPVEATARADESTLDLGTLSRAERPAEEQSIQERLEVPMLSLKLVAERPWLGHGGGSFVTAFPPHKVEGLPLLWDNAHNDFVQVASDTGLVGLLLWLMVGLTSTWRALRLLDDREPPNNKGFGAAALMALCCMGLHSRVDFNLHSPADALTFSVLLAAVWATPVSAGSKKRTRTTGSKTT